MSSQTMVTARIPEALSNKLDEAAQETRRSRSWIIKEALEQYLSRERAPEASGDILSFAGAGVKISHRRTAEEIDAEIRWLRGND